VDIRFKLTDYVVEANSFEYRCLWNQYREKTDWKDDNFGIVTTLAMVGEKNQEKRPINISCRWVKIDGTYVLFWYACSQLVDYKLIEDWFKKNCYPYEEDTTRAARCDVDNFHSCIWYARRKKEKAETETESDLLIPSKLM
jgi:hypothetical protein